MIDELTTQIQAMIAESDSAPDHLAKLNTMLEATEAIRAQLADKDEQLAGLRDQAEAAEAALRLEFEAKDARISELLATIDAATTSYRQAILASNPDIPGDLIGGSSIEELNASLESARAIVEKIRQQEAEKAANTAIPAGAPARGQIDMSQLSPMEKIRAGLGR